MKSEFKLALAGGNLLAKLIENEVNDCLSGGYEDGTMAIGEMSGYQVQVKVTNNEDDMLDVIHPGVQSIDPQDPRVSDKFQSELLETVTQLIEANERVKLVVNVHPCAPVIPLENLLTWAHKVLQPAPDDESPGSEERRPGEVYRASEDPGVPDLWDEEEDEEEGQLPFEDEVKSALLRLTPSSLTRLTQQFPTYPPHSKIGGAGAMVQITRRLVDMVGAEEIVWTADKLGIELIGSNGDTLELTSDQLIRVHDKMDDAAEEEDFDSAIHDEIMDHSEEDDEEDEGTPAYDPSDEEGDEHPDQDVENLFAETEATVSSAHELTCIQWKSRLGNLSWKELNSLLKALDKRDPEIKDKMTCNEMINDIVDNHPFSFIVKRAKENKIRLKW